LPLIIILGLISATMIQDANVAKANPNYPPMPPTPDLNEPTIKIQNPELNKTYNLNSIPYSITVNKPASWFNEYPVHGQILVIDYILDENQHVKIGDEPDYYKQGPFSFEGTLSGLSDGNHSIEVYVRSDSFYDPSNSSTQPPYPPPLDYYLDTYSGIFAFNVDTSPPTISLLSEDNVTFPSAEVPLDFAVNEPTSKLAYCLDDGDNVTISGNCTLTNLSDGLHRLTVFAWDLADNVGVSETFTFSVEIQTESTSQPEPFPTTFIPVACGAMAAIIGIGLFLYFNKRDRGRNS
jgi:hypothetical protein